MKSKTLGWLIVLAMILVLAVPVGALPDPGRAPGPAADDGAPAAPAPDSTPTDPAVYIIRLEGAPLSSYTGGIPGLEATNPAVRGESKLDAKSPASVAYLDYLAERQAQFIATMRQSLGHPVEVVYQYSAAFNGLAVRLTGAEAHAVNSLPGVLNVQRETIEQPDTDAGPTWIGAPSIWDGSGVPGGIGSMGEGAIVGVLDTGINHDHPSFADIGGDGYNHTNPWGSGVYHGYCVDNPSFCNDKLIAAYSYTGEPTSPEDTDGHGSHTSSTAAGNVITATKTTPTGFVIEKRISGVAPHANVIMFDVCSAGGCGSAGSVAAVNQAVLDGVDVINYSISGGNNPYADSVELAFLGASDAGVFVSTSAGNNGPGAGTVAHRSPWVSTVAASTHNRLFSNSLIDMAGGDTPPPADMIGQAITTGYGPAPIVYAGDYGDPLCQTPFPAGTWTNGEIVVCDRGIAGRVAKGQNVMAGGAQGYVLANDVANGDSLVADPHYLPAVHITYDDGVVLKAWLASGSGHTATIPGTTTDLSPENGDIMASFSSRGPNNTFDVLKPDVTAPGVAVFAAYMNGIELEFLGGTSMSSPHNAGAGALLSALYPDWSPAQIKSAIMTTASTANLRKEDGTTPADPFDVGAGRDDLTRAALAGLVLDITTAEYSAANPGTGGDPKTLNLPSLMNKECAGVCSWTRTVESTLDAATTWTASVDVPEGMDVTVEPATFNLAAGASQQIVVTADVSGLPLAEWSFGQVILTSSDGAVPEAHLALAVMPGAAPEIQVSPSAFDVQQRFDTIKTRPLTLSNTGNAPLDWAIYEDAGFTGAPALADWSDNFDSYPVDTSLHGVGGWKGWGNNPAATAYTRDEQARSAPNSVEIVNVSDLVHEYTGATSGLWVYTAWQYIPTTFAGETYFILLNQYDDAGATNNWSTQVDFNGTLNQVVNDGPDGGTLPLVRGQWMEIRVEIDLDNDTQAFYYGGSLLFQGSWTEGMSGGGILNVAAVDLWGNNSTSVYYDDLSLAMQVLPWSDNFDSYPVDTSLHGVGGWKGWGNNPAATAYTRDEQARSAPNSVEIVNVSDLVHEYSGYTTGIWYYTAWQYIPTDFTGESYFIMLNQYDDAGATNNWSTQVNFNGTLNQVVNDGPDGGTLPLIRGQWVEIRVEIDLVNDVQSFYYGGSLLFEGSWTEGMSGGGILNIAAVDLWGNNSTSVYYDDLSLANALPDVCDLPGDIPWASVSPASGSTPGGSSSVVDVTFDTNGLEIGSTHDGTLCITSNDPGNPLVMVPLRLTVVESYRTYLPIVAKGYQP
jgi:hypothetical protein